MAENDTSRLLIFTRSGCSDHVAQWLETAVFSLEEVGMGVQIPARRLPFFSFIVFFTLWLFTFYSHC